MPVAQTILARAAGAERMGRVMALVGVPALLAPILGPLAGGLIVDHLPWRWIFLINLPVGVASVLISVRRLPAGLLVAPQGIGTAISMPIAGALADKIGPRRVVVTGMVLVTLGTLVLTQVPDGLPSWAAAFALVVRGLGFGAAMMPAMAAGYRTLPASAAGHASSVLQIFSRVGGTIGAALMAVILTQTGDFGTAFWFATGITAVAALASLLLPGSGTRTSHKEQ
ncbi:MFS transporter [Nonomuraea rosea]